MKILSKLNNKKGLTLMELIVGMLMFSIIAVAVSMTLAPTLFAYMRANDFAEYNSLIDNIANQIISDMSQSTVAPPAAELDLWVENEARGITITMNTRIVRYTIDNGALMKESSGTVSPVFSDDFYKRKNVSFMLTIPDSINTDEMTAYILTVRLREDSDPASAFELSREYAIRPLMLNQR